MKYEKPTNFTPPSRRIHLNDLKVGDKIRVKVNVYDHIIPGSIQKIESLDKQRNILYVSQSDYFYTSEIEII